MVEVAILTAGEMVVRYLAADLDTAATAVDGVLKGNMGNGKSRTTTKENGL